MSAGRYCTGSKRNITSQQDILTQTHKLKSRLTRRPQIRWSKQLAVWERAQIALSLAKMHFKKIASFLKGNTPRNRYNDQIINAADGNNRWYFQSASYHHHHHHHHHHVHEGLGMLSCSLILKMKLVPPSLPRSSYVPSSFRSILQCLFWYSFSVHPLYML
jgi:hypothetical protein